MSSDALSQENEVGKYYSDCMLVLYISNVHDGAIGVHMLQAVIQGPCV